MRCEYVLRQFQGLGAPARKKERSSVSVAKLQPHQYNNFALEVALKRETKMYIISYIVSIQCVSPT